MKILYDHQIFLNQEYGGPSRYFVNLIKKIINGNEIKVSAPLHINNHLRQLPNRVIFGLKISKKFRKFIPQKIKNEFNNFILNPVNNSLTGSIIKKFNPEVVHQTYFENGYKKTRPTIITIYDLIHEKFFIEYGKDKNYRPKKNAIENADKIICISENTAKDLIDIYKVKKNKIEIIYLSNSLEEELILITPKINLNNLNKNYLLFVGKRDGYKNFINFIKAYSQSEKLKKDFKIVCFGNLEFSKQEKSLFKSLNLNFENIIHIKGDDLTLSHLYKNAKALVYPSLYEGFGLPILEAMNFDCPVICSNTSSMPEVAGKSAQYFDPQNIDSIQEAVTKMVYDETLSKNLIEKGKLQAKQFSWKRCANSTLNVYSKVV